MDPLPSTPRLTNDAAVARAQAGDVDAFAELYHEHVGRVFALCVRMCGDRNRAGEMVQDVFVRAWERLGSFRGEASFSSWLHRLTVNVVLTAVRTERRRDARVMVVDDLADAEATLDGPSSTSRLGDPGAAIDLERAIAALPAGARTAFVLHDVYGYTHGEIAELTGLAEGTLRAQLHRARRLLMEKLT